jgi:hypothetical protein
VAHLPVGETALVVGNLLDSFGGLFDGDIRPVAVAACHVDAGGAHGHHSGALGMARGFIPSPLLPQFHEGVLNRIGSIVTVAGDAFGQREHLLSQGGECGGYAVGLSHRFCCFYSINAEGCHL